MSGLPTSLSIGLWLTGSIWVVALVAYLIDAPREIVFAALAVGLAAGVAEWFSHRRTPR